MCSVCVGLTASVGSTQFRENLELLSSSEPPDCPQYCWCLASACSFLSSSCLFSSVSDLYRGHFSAPFWVSSQCLNAIVLCSFRDKPRPNLLFFLQRSLLAASPPHLRDGRFHESVFFVRFIQLFFWLSLLRVLCLTVMSVNRRTMG